MVSMEWERLGEKSGTGGVLRSYSLRAEPGGVNPAVSPFQVDDFIKLRFSEGITPLRRLHAGKSFGGPHRL